ncbi:MAG TPA: DUF3142 domain-containing protein [Oculatellaceae cyanobacterium]|jgi:Protein of unknown function (DUF3142)
MAANSSGTAPVSALANAQRTALTAALIAMSASLTVLARSSVARQPVAPPLRMLWAWERPEDLRFVDPRTTGIAYLAATIKVKNDRISCLNRHQPLRVPDGAYLMAVVRIESDGNLTETNQAALDTIIMAVPHLLRPNLRGVQIDFDARKSERGWYKNFLIKLRETLPADLFLSMTSLASWCLGDDWITSSQLPTDEVVPMFFDMGADTRPIGSFLDSGNTFGHTFKSIGISDKDTAINRLIGKSVAGILKPIPRVYMFSRTPWSQARVQNLMQEVNGWK